MGGREGRKRERGRREKETGRVKKGERREAYTKTQTETEERQSRKTRKHMQRHIEAREGRYTD